MVRSLGEACALVERGGVDVVQPDVVLSGGITGARRIVDARGSVRPRVEPAHVVERVRPAREPACCARLLDLPVPRGAVRPSGVVGRAARLAAPCHARDRPRRDDRPTRGARSRRRARLRRARASTGSADASRAAVLREPGSPGRKPGYWTSCRSLNIGRYIAITMIPMIAPTPIIMSGSMIEVSEAIEVSTSSS